MSFWDSVSDVLGTSKATLRRLSQLLPQSLIPTSQVWGQFLSKTLVYPGHSPLSI